MNYEDFFLFRSVLALFMFLFALWSIYKLANVNYKSYPWYAIAFWVLVPPIWFFCEYYAIDKNYIFTPAEITKDQMLSKAKDYGGFASKIWAAVLAAILFMYKRNDE